MPLRCLSTFIVVVVFLIIFAVPARSADQPQWGERHTRNMISSETPLPTSFDLKSGTHILWTAPLGGGSYSAPIIAQGKVFIGANNSEPRDARQQGDRGVMLCLNEHDGSLVWQLVAPHIGGDDYLDWPGIGMCSEPTIIGDRVYTVTNRSEVVCLDLAGMANGNDGPYLEEGRHMTPDGQPVLEPGPSDADIVWLFDLRTGIDKYPHDSPHMSLLADGDYLYLNTCNGVDNTHVHVPKPDAPSLIVLDKNTGKLVARDGEYMSRRLFHSIWSSPALGEVNGQRLIFFGGPEGVCYAFKALAPGNAPETVQTLECVWRFDCDPMAPKEDVHKFSKNMREGPSEIMGMPVFYRNRVYVTVGGDIWWGKRQSWLKCINATQSGDVTTSAGIWSYAMKAHCCSTPAIVGGLVFVADESGGVHCLDAETGAAYWTHDVGAKIWGSPLAADGKVFVGAHDGALSVFAADKSKQLLFATQFGDEINGTATAANGVLYVATLSRLYAIQ